MDATDRARRVRAVRELAGYRTPEALADAMKKAGKRGFSYGTLKAYEREGHDQEVVDYKLNELARFCGVSPAIFTVDLETLSPPSVDGEVQAPPGALGQTARDSQTTPEHKARNGNQSAEDRQKGAG